MWLIGSVFKAPKLFAKSYLSLETDFFMKVLRRTSAARYK